MIEDLMIHQRTTFTTNEDLVDQSFRSPYFEDLEEINGAFKIKECKRQINISRCYQCAISVYQPAKLRMLEFYYDFLDKYLGRRGFELIQMDTNLMYMAISGTSIDKIIKAELLEECHNRGIAKFLSTCKYHDRTPGLFKAEFQVTRMIALTSKCYYTENEKSKPKLSCKGISKRQNPKSWVRYIEALNRSIERASNTGF